MKDLIEALQIFMKYCGNIKYPTTCVHDELIVTCVRPDDVSHEDLQRLNELEFFPYEGYGFVSYRYGSN